VEVDAKGRFLFVSPNCSSMLGYEAEELVGKTLRESVLAAGLHRADLSSLAEPFAHSLESPDGGAFECRFRHRDGRWRWFECSAKSYRNGGGALRGVVIVRDVTQRVKAERELREGEERFRVLAEATHDLVVELDSEGRVVYRNPDSLALLGDPPGSLVGTSPFARIHPDEVERAVSLFLEHMKTVGPVPSEV
jgi:PAS domain S-box-containing protein